MRIFLLSLLSLSQTVLAQTPTVDYHLTVTDAAHHLAEVEIIFPHMNAGAMEVKMPVWRSGRYEILDLPKGVRHFSAGNRQGQAYSFEKTDKNTWQINVPEAGQVLVRYQLYANMLSHRVRHIDSTHAYLDASGVFMYSPPLRSAPVNVRLTVPSGWQSRSGMQSTGPHQFTAANYDILVDSPIESGIHDFRAFTIDGMEYEIVVWGEGNYQMDQLQADITALHHAAATIWGSYPFERYVYMYHIGDGLRGATEHLNSTIIQWDRFGFYPREQYNKIIGTTAHEFVHTWNVKAYRPAGITPYNYNAENYADLLWMAEGTTSYYDNLLPARAGIYTVEEYLKELSKSIEAHLKKPGRRVMSVQEASFNKWMVEDHDRNLNASVSIYLEGALVSWLMDQRIRELSKDRYSMDDLQNWLFENYEATQKGYTEADVLIGLQTLTGHSFAQFWDDHVRGTQAIDFEQLLAFYGLQFKPPKKLKDDEKPKTWIGADTAEKDGLLSVRHVALDSPAWKAGLSAGDTIVALDGYQLKPKSAKQRLESLDAGKSIRLHYFNNGRLLETELTPVLEPVAKISIMAVERPSKKQRQRFSDWMKIDWDKAFAKKKAE